MAHKNDMKDVEKKYDRMPAVSATVKNNTDTASPHVDSARSNSSNHGVSKASNMASNVKHTIQRISTVTVNTVNVDLAKRYDAQTVGLGEVAKGELHTYHGPIEEHEAKVREDSKACWLVVFATTLISAVLVFVVYLISLETVMSSVLCVLLTIYWYETSGENDSWSGSGMDWIVLGFAVVTPLTVTISMAFQRRERALYEISRFRSSCFQIYLAHAIWDWNSGEGKNQQMNRDQWLEHTDQVLEHLVGIGDELSRFLTLPTSSRSYHRMLKGGRQKAANIVEVAYRLFDSLYTQRIVQIAILAEKLKAMGLQATEVSRMRQYERFIGEAIESLRMVKMYRTPQALRSFGRIFTLILPSFYAPAFAQLALDLQSRAMGIIFAVLTPLVLTALFQTVRSIEDPFVGFITLDGIDVIEEMEVLHFHQLISARTTLFPDAPPYEPKSKAAIVPEGPAVPNMGMSIMGMGGSYRVSNFAKSVGDVPVGDAQDVQDINTDGLSNLAANDNRRTSLGFMSRSERQRSRFGSTF